MSLVIEKKVQKLMNISVANFHNAQQRGICMQSKQKNLQSGKIIANKVVLCKDHTVLEKKDGAKFKKPYYNLHNLAL